jgi:hypothetical protein
MTKRQSKPAAATPTAPDPVITFDNLSLDLGNAYCNLAGDNGLSLDLRSIMAPLSEANKLGDWPIEDVIRFNGQWWVVGDRSYTLAPDAIQEHPTVNRYVSEWYKRLFAFALHKAFYKRVGSGIIYPRIISSVPAQLFKNQAETAAIKDNLAGEYEISNVYGGTLYVTVMPRQIVLIPEGIGTYFGFVFSPGNNSQYQTGTWLIADSGYLTLDSVMVRDGEYMPDAARSDEKTGISIVAEALRDMVFTKTRVRLDRAAIDKALECDTITVNQKIHPIAETKTKLLEQVGQRAVLLLEQWSAGQNLSGILLTGGGAKFLYPYLSSASLPPVMLSNNPRRANVEGAYLYLADSSGN